MRYRPDAAVALGVSAETVTQADGEMKKLEIGGRVREVSTVAGLLVIETERGKSVVVFVTSKTVITHGGQPVTLADIAPGSRVKVKLPAVATVL